MKKATLSALSLRRWLALAAASVFLSACGSDNAKPSAPQAAAIAAEAAQRPPEITVQPLSKATLSGTSTTFNVTATGDALTYQWLSNGVAVPNGNGPTLTTATATTAESGTKYTVVVSNSHGQVTSQAAVLTISEAMFSN
jgi:hypothetical protein